MPTPITEYCPRCGELEQAVGSQCVVCGTVVQAGDDFEDTLPEDWNSEDEWNE